MRYANDKFRHESLEDTDSIRKLLETLSKGIANGQISFSDENGEIRMRPHGLLNFRLSASHEEELNKISIHISWQNKVRRIGKKHLSVRAGHKKLS